MGDAAVLLVVAQPGICAFRFCARVVQSLQPDGVSGLTWAPSTRTFGLARRGRPRIVVYAFKISAGVLLLHRSLVAKCNSTMSAGLPSNQVARSRASDTYGSFASAPLGRTPVPAAL